MQGASGKLQAFGFCEYGDPESALRAIRILHEWSLGDKKLVVGSCFDIHPSYIISQPEK